MHRSRFARRSTACRLILLQGGRLRPFLSYVRPGELFPGTGGNLKLAFSLLWVCLLPLSTKDSGQAAKAAESDQPIYRHAYYLFLAGNARGCEECYVPLLITVEPL